jgi:hypothetical protein
MGTRKENNLNRGHYMQEFYAAALWILCTHWSCVHSQMAVMCVRLKQFLARQRIV